jgi:hypothetical protein
VLPSKSGFHLLFLLPKYPLGEHKLSDNSFDYHDASSTYASAMNQHDTFYAWRDWFDRRQSSFGGIGSSDDGSSGVFEVLFEGVSTFLVHNAETCSEHAF